jgi:uncharacterized membrane-anchored protein YjiN (DUF445 family)
LKPDFRKYLSRHFSFKGVFPSKQEPHLLPGQTAAEQKRRIGLMLLQWTAWICGAGFVLSFFLDFGPQHQLKVLGQVLPLENLLRITSISGLIGFGTNWLAIRMLFKPVQRRPVWGQGLIPAQRDRIIAGLARGIHENILSEELIRQRIHESGVIPRLNHVVVEGAVNILHDTEFREELKAFVKEWLTEVVHKEETIAKVTGVIDQKLEEKFNTGLKGFLFRSYRRMNPNDYEAMISGLVKGIPDAAVEGLTELEKMAPSLAGYLQERKPDLESFFTKVVMDVLDRADIRALLVSQMQHFDEQKLEKLIWSSTNEQLLYIQNLGTVLGILGGLLIWEPVFMGVLYGSILLLMYLADVILYRLKQKKS